jgi:hypothetical protein
MKKVPPKFDVAIKKAFSFLVLVLKILTLPTPVD